MGETSSRIVYERRARQTGTVVQIVDRGPNDYERAEAAEQGIDWNRWETICVDHGGVCSHAERSSTRREHHACLSRVLRRG